MLLTHKLSCPLEVNKAVWLKKVINCTYLITFSSMLCICCGKDNKGRIRKRLHEIHTIDVRHIYVYEKSIHLAIRHHLHSLTWAGTCSNQLQIRNLIYIVCKLLESHRLIVNSDASYTHNPGIVNETLKLSLSSSISRLYLSV